MALVVGFPPIVGRGARSLILGSMPGIASLEEGRYYAHPRNAFWPLMGEFFAAGPEVPYRERTRILKRHGIAVWDVCRACFRPGSLDAAIEPESVEANDFAGLLACHRGIRRIFFNGAAAEDLFRRLVLPGLGDRAATLALRRLPSTNPANASWSYARKRRTWGAALASEEKKR